MPETCPRRDTSRLARSLHDAAHLFNVASNSIRLQVLFVLTNGGHTLAQISEDLGKEGRLVGQYVRALARGGLIDSGPRGQERIYTLTPAGAGLIRAVGAIIGLPEGESPPPPGRPALPEERRDGSATAAIDGLVHIHGLLKTLADPVRLRLLSLLATAGEVCVCHLHGALELPQSTVSRHLTNLREAGLIIGRREGTWIYYRLARPADDLHGVLIGQFSPRFVESETFDADRGRLKALSPCKVQ